MIPLSISKTTMPLDPETERLVSAALLRLRMRAPFFATLALFARVEASDQIDSAATDGRNVFLNPGFFQSLSPPQQDQLLLHQVLHAALLHVTRRGGRDQRLWNVACDIVVNGLIAGTEGFQLPSGALRDQRREQLSVEEVYELLLLDPLPPASVSMDLLDRPEAGASEEGGGERDSIATARDARLEAHWRDAHQHAGIIALAVAQGKLPAGLARELGMLSPARLDWHAHLWRYIILTPSDFQGFDRRFIHQRLYLEALESESVRVYVAVDTSGSVDDRQIRALVGEVQGILSAYPHVICDLYYADADLYGPHRLTAHGEIPQPQGGGGTDFRPFFTAIAERHDAREPAVCVYLTDGYGDFPADPPELPVLWVVTAGGRALDAFPFGEAARLLADDRA
jgi:predicted metal-dependent peptidase